VQTSVDRLLVVDEIHLECVADLSHSRKRRRKTTSWDLAIAHWRNATSKLNGNIIFPPSCSHTEGFAVTGKASFNIKDFDTGRAYKALTSES